MHEALLDSSTYIDLEKTSRNRGKVWARNTIQHMLDYRDHHAKPFLSVITVVEILRGLHRGANPSKAIAFKASVPSNFQFLDVTTEIAYLASETLSRLESARQNIGIADCLIAATALHHGLVLVTSNITHFERVIKLGYPLRVENWREQ